MFGRWHKRFEISSLFLLALILMIYENYLLHLRAEVCDGMFISHNREMVKSSPVWIAAEPRSVRESGCVSGAAEDVKDVSNLTKSGTLMTNWDRAISWMRDVSEVSKSVAWLIDREVWVLNMRKSDPIEFLSISYIYKAINLTELDDQKDQPENLCSRNCESQDRWYMLHKLNEGCG